MANSSVLPPESPPQAPTESQVAAIDRRIRQTRQQLKLNDFATGLIALVAGLLGYLFAAALADHWLVSGGLGFWGRFWLFLGLLGGAGWYCVRALLPPLIYQVNPIFAAKTLEQARPSLKNGLINLLLLRREGNTGHANPLAERVLTGLQTTTATELDQIPHEVAVDRIHLIRRGYVLVGLVAVAALYLVFSPKNPVPSFGRVLWPWAPISAPSRVQIGEVTPGNATLFQGRSVLVSASVEGLRADEEVLLRYSTEDGQIVDQAIPMTPGQTQGRHECQLPPTKAGLQQPLRYRLVAGDCVTAEYLLQMEIPPTIVLDSVRYTYPRYTGLPERVETDSADIRAIEGTKIAVQATANREIQWAGIEMNGRPDRRSRMRTDGNQARGEFTLKLGEGGEELQQWYQIRFAESETGESRENLEPVRHRIEVFADRAPQVRLVDPPPESATVALDGVAELTVEASDPDFALARVAVLVERDGRPLPIPLLLDRTDSNKGFEGLFNATYRFQPGELGLRVGDEVQYRAVAEDNRQPQRNRSETDRRWLKIGPPERSDEAPRETGNSESSGRPQGSQPLDEPRSPDDPANQGESGQPEMDAEQNDPGQPEDKDGQGAESTDQQPGQEGEAGEESEQPGDKGSPQDNPQQQPGDEKSQGGAESGQEGNQEGSDGAKRKEPLNGETNPGDVFEEVLKQREKDMQEDGAEQPQNGGQPGEQSESEPQPAEEPQTGEGEPAGKPQPGEQSDGAQEQPGESEVPPNRMEQGGEQGGNEGAEESPEDPEAEGQGGQPNGTTGSDSQGQSPESESDATGGTPNGKPGKGETSDDAETVDGGQAKPEDVENGKVESVQRKPADPGDGKEPEHSQTPQPGSPEAGDPKGGDSTQKPEDAQPTPMPQETNQPNAEKPTGGQQVDQQQKPEATSPSTSKKQSNQDQREPTDGDKSGSGGEGGGQDSDREGLGNPGSSTPDDEGGQPGGEQGQGETGPGAGEQVPTDQSTGNQAKQSGGKGQGEDSPQGADPGQMPQENSQLPQGEQPPSETPSDAAGGTPGRDPRQQADSDPKSRQPGGATGDGPESGEGSGPEPLGSEAANKEYSDKATNLALEYLEDQLNQAEPNQQLLDRLGWTRQDLERFVSRWQKMKADAKESSSPDAPARRELDDALKSLGLRPAGVSIETGRLEQDTLGKTESIRSPPPPAWRELTQEYTRSIGSGEK